MFNCCKRNSTDKNNDFIVVPIEGHQQQCFTNFDRRVNVSVAPQKSSINEQQLLEDLEKKGFEQMNEILSKHPDGADILGGAFLGKDIQTENKKEEMNKLGADLMSIITNGAKEFEEKTGRPMSYAEMRAAYG